MPTLYKVVAIFGGQERGWTETYMLDAEVSIPAIGANPQLPDYNLGNLDAVADFALYAGPPGTGGEGMLRKRRKLLGAEYRIKGLRVSKWPTTQRVSLTRYFSESGFSAHEGDAVEACLIADMANSDRTRSRRMYLRGIWDGVNVAGGVFSYAAPGEAVWGQYWTEYRTALINQGWGWYAKLQGFRADLLNYTSGEDGFVTFTFKPIADGVHLFDGLAPGTKLVLSLRQVNIKSELNGPQLVRVDDNTSCTTVKRISVFPYVGGGSGSWHTSAFARFARVEPQKIGSRDTGAPLLEPRGRRSARVVS